MSWLAALSVDELKEKNMTFLNTAEVRDTGSEFSTVYFPPEVPS